MLRMKSRPACLGHGQQTIDILLLYLEIEDIEVCLHALWCGGFRQGQDIILQAEAQTDLRRTFAVFFRKLQNQGDSMPPPVCRGSGRTVMFHTADSRGEIQTDQSWGRYWRFSERAGGAAAGNCRHRWHARRLHHKAAPTHASLSSAFQLSVTSGFQSAPGKGRGQ